MAEINLLLPDLPEDALSMRFFEPSRSGVFPDGYVHEKVVPYTIVAQPLEGVYEITSGGRHEFIRPGEAFLVGANQPMRIVHHGDPEHEGRMSSWWLHFHFVLFETIDFTALFDLPLRVPEAAGRRFSPLIDEAVSRARKHQTASSPLDRLVVRQALGLQALQIVCGISTPRPEAIEMLRHAERLMPALRYVRENLDSPITVSALARTAHMSRSRFHALFREKMGCSPMEYVKNLRLAEGHRALWQTEEPIYAVAARVGFPNPFHFSREFKARFGMTPTERRRSRD